MKHLLCKVLFQHFEALSILLTPSVLMPLYTLGIPTALVVDCGYEEATILPVYEGVPIIKAWKGSPNAGQRAIHEELRTLLKQRGKFRQGQGDLRSLSEDEELMTKVFDEKVIEDIKVRLCFVTKLERGSKIRKEVDPEKTGESGISKFVPGVSYPIGGDAILQIDGATREAACEVIFDNVRAKKENYRIK